MSSLPPTQRALVVTSRDVDPEVKVVETPQSGPGSAVVKVLAATVLAYGREIYNGTRPYPFPTPMIPGTSAIARIAAVGPDATLLKPGDLVWIDITIRGRDDPDSIILSGVSSAWGAGSNKLMEGEWRNSTYAEYAKVPLENCHVLDEARLLGSPQDGGLGYSLETLPYMSTLVVSYGGLSDIDLKPGETIIITPATGAFGGAAVFVALALGAKVIAMGRNAAKLQRMAAISDRVHTVQMTNDVETDIAALQRFGRIDAFFDISPPQATSSTHIKSCIIALKRGGRGSLMGGQQGDVAIPLFEVMRKDIQLKGKWMYDRGAIQRMISMIENGILRLGPETGVKVTGKYKLEEWDAAFTNAAENVEMGLCTLITP